MVSPPAVEELLIVDSGARTVAWFARDANGFVAAHGSVLLGISSADPAAAIAWPA